LVYTTQLAPLTATSGGALDFTTDPVVEAQDANGTLDSGFTSTVTLTETGSGSATYTNNSVTAVGGVVTFTGLTVTYTATADQETFALQTAGGDLSPVNSATIFTRVPLVLVDFSGLSAPPFTPTLDWNDVANAASYTLEYAENVGFTGATTVTGLTVSQFTFPSPLADGTYFWRVNAVAANASEIAFSSVDSFVIIPTFTQWTVILLAFAMMGYLVLRQWRTRA